MIPLNTIQCRDCLEGMRDIPDKIVDLVITSPPYNLGDDYKLAKQPNSTIGQKHYGEYDDKRSPENYVIWLNEVLKRRI